MDEHYPPSIPEQQRIAGMQPQQAALENAQRQISPQTHQNMIGQRVKPPPHGVLNVCAEQMALLNGEERERVLRALAALFGIEEL